MYLMARSKRPDRATGTRWTRTHTRIPIPSGGMQARIGLSISQAAARDEAYGSRLSRYPLRMPRRCFASFALAAVLAIVDAVCTTGALAPVGLAQEQRTMSSRVTLGSSLATDAGPRPEAAEDIVLKVGSARARSSRSSSSRPGRTAGPAKAAPPPLHHERRFVGGRSVMPAGRRRRDRARP